MSFLPNGKQIIVSLKGESWQTQQMPQWHCFAVLKRLNDEFEAQAWYCWIWN
jgi:hypothetical protein